MAALPQRRGADFKVGSQPLDFGDFWSYPAKENIIPIKMMDIATNWLMSRISAK
jgi:hypothetical protein